MSIKLHEIPVSSFSVIARTHGQTGLKTVLCGASLLELMLIYYTLCLKKVPTFKLSVTLSNLSRFSTFLHCWKAYEICYKTRMTVPTSP